MGLMTPQQLVDETRYAMDNREVLDIPVAQMLRYVNWAYNHVTEPKVFRHPEMQLSLAIPMVAGTFSYAVTQNRGFRSVGNTTDGYRLRPRPVEWFDERPRSGGGRPAVFVREGSNVLLHSTPNAADTGKIITVRYWAIPAALTIGGANTLLTPTWDEIIVLGATWRAWRQANRPDHAEIAKQDYGALINEVGGIEKLEGELWDHQAEPTLVPYMET